MRPEVSVPVGPGHTVTLNAADAARLRAWLAKPEGSFTADRMTVEAVEGGGILVRTHPRCPDDSLYRPVLDLLRQHGLPGASPAALNRLLPDVKRESIMTALRWLRAQGLAENHQFGAWRSTVRQRLHVRDYEEGFGW